MLLQVLALVVLFSSIYHLLKQRARILHNNLLAGALHTRLDEPSTRPY
jgi:hypothetical protein